MHFCEGQIIQKLNKEVMPLKIVSYNENQTSFIKNSSSYKADLQRNELLL